MTDQNPQSAPQPMVIQKTWEDRLWSLMPLAIVVVLGILVKSGVIDLDTAKEAGKLIPVAMAPPPREQETEDRPSSPRMVASAAGQLHVRDLQGTELTSLSPGVPCMAVADDGSEVVVSQSKSVRYKVDSGWLVIPESGDVIGFYGAGQMRVFLVAGKDASPESSIQSRVDDVEKSVDGLAANVETMRGSMVDLAKELKTAVDGVDAASKRIAALEGARPPPDVQPNVSGLAINCAVKYLAAMSAASDRAAKRLRNGDSEKAVIVEMGESFNSAMLNSYLPLTDKMNTLKTAGDKAAELESWSKQWTQPAVAKLAE